MARVTNPAENEKFLVPDEETRISFLLHSVPRFRSSRLSLFLLSFALVSFLSSFPSSAFLLSLSQLNFYGHDQHSAAKTPNFTFRFSLCHLKNFQNILFYLS